MFGLLTTFLTAPLFASESKEQRSYLSSFGTPISATVGLSSWVICTAISTKPPIESMKGPKEIQGILNLINNAPCVGIATIVAAEMKSMFEKK